MCGSGKERRDKAAERGTKKKSDEGASRARNIGLAKEAIKARKVRKHIRKGENEKQTAAFSLG